MRVRARAMLVVLVVSLTAAGASAQVDHFPVNDDGAHEMFIQGASHTVPYEVCDPPLGLWGGSYYNAGAGDEPFGVMSPDDNGYCVLSFDSWSMTCGEMFTLFLVEEGRWGEPFAELGPEMIVEYLTSTLAYPDRGVNPDEIEGSGYSLLGTVTAPELYCSGGIDVSDAINSLICDHGDRYLYLRFRFPICTNLNDVPDWTEIVTDPGEPGRIRIQEGGPVEIFRNGFESNNTSDWSDTVP